MLTLCRYASYPNKCGKTNGEICDRIGKEVGLIDAHPEAKYANVFFFRAEGARGTKNNVLYKQGTNRLCSLSIFLARSIHIRMKGWIK